MKNMMVYKGYAARIEFDAEDRIFVGHLTGIADRVSFHAETVKGLERAFHEAVNDYLAACAAFGKTPAKTVSGKVMLRLAPELHAQAVMRSKASGKSLNAWIADLIGERVAA